MPAAVIETETLGKTYGAKPALIDLNLAVEPGEVFGYLGPNGAGKTTTIRILLDIIRPSTGRAAIFGLDPRRDRVALHRRIGYMPGELNLWSSLTGDQVVRYVGRMRASLDMAHVHRLAERLLLDLSRRVHDYSSGNRRKLGIVLALMHRPDLLILDEPTNGLDPLIQQEFYQLVREARDEGCTLFLSSHVLSEVQAICDRVGILRNGCLQAIERIDALTHTDFRWVTVTLRERVPPERLAGVSGVSEVSVLDGDTLRLRLVGSMGPLLTAIGADRIADITTERPTLEEIFLAFYGEGGEPLPALSSSR
jgi:ABC-2 type transport system ATP-binding protein